MFGRRLPGSGPVTEIRTENAADPRMATRSSDEVAAAVPPALPEAERGQPDLQESAQVDLIRRARHGDATAFEELVAPLLQPAYQLAVRLVGDRHLAEDVTQEALIKAYTGIGQFRADARFSTWVFRIVHNACTDALRYRARRPQVSIDATVPTDDGDRPAYEPADPAPGPEDAALEHLGRRAILDAMRRLPEEYRSVLVLRDVQGLSYEEVAAVTGQNLGTVKSRLHRARAALRGALGPM